MRNVAALACALVLSSVLPDAPARTPERYVLLVGVGRYPSLKPAFQLSGPPNDVRLIARILTGDPFHLDPTHITILTDWQTDRTLTPTRANIEREFQKLAAEAREGDQVFILMGGHGSQQPADDDPNDFEPDGLDEIFLPSDVRGWDGKKGTVVNAIVDDEIKIWIDRIRKTGSFVFIAFDSCHSGTMVRGAPSSVERERQVPMEELIPPSTLRRVQGGTRGVATAAEEARADDLNFGSGDVVALYAAQPSEVTPEMGTPSYGLFTSTMAEVLVQARSPITYRELAERITNRYRTLNRAGPTPMLEGTGTEREVLGQKTWTDRPQWTLDRNGDKKLTVSAGRLAGLTTGSVLEVFPPAGVADADHAIGYVKVSEAGPLESIVEPVAFGSLPKVASDKLTIGNRCRITQADFGEMTLRIGLQRQGQGNAVETLPVGAAPAPVRNAMRRLSEQSRGFARAVDDPEQADWFVRLLNGKAVLIPASGLAAPRTNPASASATISFEVSKDIGDSFEPQLVSAVTRIARARNLLALAGANDTASDGAEPLKLKVEMLRPDGTASGGATPVEFGARGRVMHENELVAFRLTNAGDVDIDVTLLHVDSSFQILSLFPSRGTLNNRLERGKTYTTRFYKVSAPFGTEEVIAIAVPSGRPPVSFASLEQDPLSETRGGHVRATSPLGKLLGRAMDRDGATRSLTVWNSQRIESRFCPGRPNLAQGPGPDQPIEDDSFRGNADGDSSRRDEPFGVVVGGVLTASAALLCDYAVLGRCAEFAQERLS